MRKFLGALLLIVFLGLAIYSCTKTITKTVTVTLTDTITNTTTIVDSNVHLNDGLVAYYAFSGDATDSSANKLNGLIVGGVTFSTDISGKANSAVSFDGSTGYILVPDSTGKFQNNAVTLSFFTKLNDITPREVFVTDVNFADGSGQSYDVSMNAPGFADLFTFAVPNNTVGCQIPSYVVSSAITAANYVIANKWYHITAIFSDSLQQIFVNGILNTAVTQPYGTPNKCSANSLTIGGFWHGDIQSLNGSMDELRIYNRALNQNEISTLAKAVR